MSAVDSTVFADRLRRLGDVGARPVPSGLHHSRTAEFRGQGSSPSWSSFACRTIIPAAPSRIFPRPPMHGGQRFGVRSDRRSLSHSRFGRRWRSSPSRTTHRTAGTTSAGTVRRRTRISPYAKRKQRGQHAVQHDEPHSDDGADPGPAADEPIRRQRHARWPNAFKTSPISHRLRASPTTCRWTR